MTRSLLTPVVLVPMIGVVLVLLGYVFEGIKPCRRFAPLCRFMCIGIIVGCTAGLFGEFVYDFVERWLFRNVPIRSVMRLIDVVFDLGYARYLGIVAGAVGAIWFWYVRSEALGDSRDTGARLRNS